MLQLKKMIKFIAQRVFPHFYIVLGVMLITFKILDGFNPTMGFMDYWVSETILYVLCGMALVGGILTIVIDRLEYKEKQNSKDNGKGE